MKFDAATLDRVDAFEILSTVVMPRPIAWVSTVSRNGTFNLAPFAFFQCVSASPMLISLGIAHKRDGTKKDTLVNIEAIKEFVVNVVTEDLVDAANKTSSEYPPEVDEFKEAGLTPVLSDIVKAPRLLESPVNVECALRQIDCFSDGRNSTSLVIADVLRIHVKDEFCIDGHIDAPRLKLLGRLWGQMFCRLTDVFELKRPYTFR